MSDLTQLLHFRASPDLARKLAEAAREEELPVSTFIRHSLVRSLRRRPAEQSASEVA